MTAAVALTGRVIGRYVRDSKTGAIGIVAGTVCSAAVGKRLRVRVSVASRDGLISIPPYRLRFIGEGEAGAAVQAIIDAGIRELRGRPGEGEAILAAARVASLRGDRAIPRRLTCWSIPGQASEPGV